MARRLAAHFVLIVCDATARAVTFVVGSLVASPWSQQGWVKTQRKYPLTLKWGKCTYVSMMQWRHVFGKICDVFYMDRLKVFLGTLCPMHLSSASCFKEASAEHLGDVCQWLQLFLLLHLSNWWWCGKSGAQYRPCDLACVFTGREWTTEDDNGSSPSKPTSVVFLCITKEHWNISLYQLKRSIQQR